MSYTNSPYIVLLLKEFILLRVCLLLKLHHTWPEEAPVDLYEHQSSQIDSLVSRDLWRTGYNAVIQSATQIASDDGFFKLCQCCQLQTRLPKSDVSLRRPLNGPLRPL